MKHLVCGLTFAAIALAQHPKVSDCFKVHELLRADEEHYWATWTNSCPYTIDAVYVTVRFADRSSQDLADGVWSLHFIPPGTHRTMRFSAPGRIADFASVHYKKITADMGEAFGREVGAVRPALSSVEMAAVSAYRGAVAKESDSRSQGLAVSSVITDDGEAPAAIAAAAYKEAVLKDVLQSTGSQATLVARPAIVGDAGEALFRTDFPDAWQAVLSPQESAVSIAPRGSFVRFVSDEKPIFQ
ncbi:MAG TPA: hypothetical protein VK752_26145 [Bryobacteraceae bacterium]|jgi:hypothetical protein|nr:hypothetical protein [Bryobacteraceae bacterium]